MAWQLAPSWDDVRSSLTEWMAEASDTSGCTDLAEPCICESRVGRDSPDCPLIVLLEALRDGGWRLQQGVVTHSRESRDFSVRDVMHKRNYLQVILRWEDFPMLADMRSDQPKMYYACFRRPSTTAERSNPGYLGRRCASRDRRCTGGGVGRRR